jgi:hypothetical protein
VTRVPDRRFTADEVDAAVQALGSPERFARAQDIVTHAAPGLQRVLEAALAEGGWFDSAHVAEVRRVAAIEEPDERQRAIGALIAEENRVAMLVGVAVGLELGSELRRVAAGGGRAHEDDDHPQET